VTALTGHSTTYIRGHFVELVPNTRIADLDEFGTEDPAFW